ncbi:ABC transporter permease [Caulobacter sp. CCUG 60055]|uniref:ABC transporter permease n=1 Tax=Caulobacter sp. CCUG 60055 TaxID=2100090 RepID=UPI001FA74B6B|nr:FtsX-like permease family protein [Caulobacter sp. CCUG 60055]MBQ1544059.1 hypothetical protein [Caulobacteraceae bacterium]MCI3180483.1 ABC transporter permease [Caulobacter sp. CCUG 60055]
MSIALKTLTYEWRRFAPAVIAVGFSGLLVLLQAAVILGIFSLSSLYVTRSSADLWVGFPGVQSIDLGRPIAGTAELFLRMDPHVKRVEPFVWGSGEWRTGSRGMVNVYIVGIDTHPDAMVLADALSPEQRRLLLQPDVVLADTADFRKLGVKVGDVVEINGRQVKVVGSTRGLRGLGGVNVITSLANARRLDPNAGPGDDVAYFVAQVDDPRRAAAVADELNAVGKRRGFEAMTAKRFADRTTRYWLAESGAGVAFVFGSVVAILVAVVITSQTLAAAVAASLKDYAALRALGFSMGALRSIVLGQTLWIGVAGVGVAALLTVGLIGLAGSQAVPIVLSPAMMATAAVLVILVALLSGVFALRRVAQADPASLLL